MQHLNHVVSSTTRIESVLLHDTSAKRERAASSGGLESDADHYVPDLRPMQEAVTAAAYGQGLRELHEHDAMVHAHTVYSRMSQLPAQPLLAAPPPLPVHLPSAAPPALPLCNMQRGKWCRPAVLGAPSDNPTVGGTKLLPSHPPSLLPPPPSISPPPSTSLPLPSPPLIVDIAAARVASDSVIDESNPTFRSTVRRHIDNVGHHFYKWRSAVDRIGRGYIKEYMNKWERWKRWFDRANVEQLRIDFITGLPCKQPGPCGWHRLMRILDLSGWTMSDWITLVLFLVVTSMLCACACIGARCLIYGWQKARRAKQQEKDASSADSDSIFFGSSKDTASDGGSSRDHPGSQSLPSSTGLPSSDGTFGSYGASSRDHPGTRSLDGSQSLPSSGLHSSDGSQSLPSESLPSSQGSLVSGLSDGSQSLPSESLPSSEGSLATGSDAGSSSGSAGRRSSAGSGSGSGSGLGSGTDSGSGSGSDGASGSSSSPLPPASDDTSGGGASEQADFSSISGATSGGGSSERGADGSFDSFDSAHSRRDIDVEATSIGMDNAPCMSPAFRYLRRLSFFAPVFGTTLFAMWLVWCAIRINGISVVEATFLCAVSILIYNNAVGFWAGTFGFFLKLFFGTMPASHDFGRAGDVPRSCTTVACPLLGLPRSQHLGIRTAIVMPIYNESVERVIAGLDASAASLIRFCDENGISLDLFELFIMSDSGSPEIIAHEQLQLARYCRYSQRRGLSCTYRLRRENFNKKVGNLLDFIERFGHSFEAMIVLDADSLMSGQSMCMLAQLMQDNPSVGLVQLQPMPVRQASLFGRIYQFSACTFSELFAHGYAFWWLDSSSFFGHNAILRIEPFKEHCVLPMLPLAGPLGGHVLSHDNVEAALMAAAGWAVWMVPLGDGSYEEIPTNLIDHLAREFRWLNGELQHLQLLTLPGLSAISRYQLVSSVLSYLVNSFWLYTWVIAAHEMARCEWGQLHSLTLGAEGSQRRAMLGLLGLSIVIICGSRLQVLVLVLVGREKAPGGVCAFVASLVAELLFSSIVTPLVMGFVNMSIIQIVLFGKSSSWTSQDREGRALTFCEVFSKAGPIAFLFSTVPFVYLCLGAELAAIWLSPLALSVVLAVPLTQLSSEQSPCTKRLHLFSTRFEEEEPYEVTCFEAASSSQPWSHDGPPKSGGGSPPPDASRASSSLTLTARAKADDETEPEASHKARGGGSSASSDAWPGSKEQETAPMVQSMQQLMEDQLERDTEVCVVCMNDNHRKTHAFVPCGHRCVCQECGERIMARKASGRDADCPICRLPAMMVMPVFDV